MPKFCYEEQNLITIVIHIINNVLKLYNKDDICDNKKLGRKQMEKYKFESICYKLGGKLITLQKCFPNLNIVNEDVFPETYTDEDVNIIISDWVKENNLNVNDLLQKGNSYKYSKLMSAMLSVRFHKNKLTYIDMIIWYCNRNNILHPQYNRPIIQWDFEEMPSRFWYNKENRISRIKYYCEIECSENILNVINDTSLLKYWIYKYFKQEHITKIISYSPKGFYLYELLIEAYPNIKNNYVLFEWEWHQYSKNDKNSLIKMVRELVLYRMNDVIKDIKNDLPNYFNSVYLSKIYPKFKKQIHKKRFDSYYEWACLSFPEYSNYWTTQMFSNNVAYDGSKCGSKQEMLVYEFLKKDLNFKYLKNIGNQKTGKYTFKLDKTYDYERFCPDFVLEYIEKDNIKIKLNKPLFIEFYGMYMENNKNYIFQNYVEKTRVKNSFYQNNSDIYFIDLYPQDLNNGLEGVREKINNIINNIICVS
jgi:hypothetical protein